MYFIYIWCKWLNVKEEITIQKHGESNFAKFNQIRQHKFHIFESCVDILNFLFAFHYIPGSFKIFNYVFFKYFKVVFLLKFLDSKQLSTQKP